MPRNLPARRRRNIHLRVYEKSRWQCEMPVCHADSRDIDPALRGTDDPWAPSIDHMVLLADRGRDVESNMRAAHRKCNEQGAKDRPRKGYKIMEMYPDLVFLAREIVRE